MFFSPVLAQDVYLLFLSVLPDPGQWFYTLIEGVHHSFIYEVYTQQRQEPACREYRAEGVAEEVEHKQRHTLARVVAGEAVVLAEEAREDEEGAEIAQRREDAVLLPA